MKTELLYYNDSHLYSFDANCLSCKKNGKSFDVVLDKTAFFPAGGGQSGDVGKISGATVINTVISDGVVHHLCTSPVKTGSVSCFFDGGVRFKRMQLHSGEHIVSGVAHTLFGCENVGFHMTDNEATVDFDRELTEAELSLVEKKANEAVWQNLPIRAYFPTQDELKELHYRSKLDLTENVRVVEISGIDLCACCAPHVSFTGEIGLIKITDKMRHRSGIRFTLKCGESAFEDYSKKHSVCAEVGALLSAKTEDIAAKTEKLLADFSILKREFAIYKKNVALACADNMTRENNCAYYVTDDFDSDMLRELAVFVGETAKISAVFSGDDNKGYSFVAFSKTVASKELSSIFSEKLGAKGGGRDGLIQGSASCTKLQITELFGNIQE